MLLRSFIFLLNVKHTLLEKKSLGIFILSSIISHSKFFTILYTALLHGTVDEEYLLQDFELHFFHDTYSEEVLQMNTDSTADIS